MNTCIEEPCLSKAKNRGLCGKHYHKHWRAGTLDVVSPNTTRHNISNVDAVTKTATCALCGPTIVKLEAKQWRCISTRRWKSRDATESTGEAVTKYLEMMETQNGLCAICKKPEPLGRELAIDHCHTTGAIRGLLCTKCNLGLGMLGDDLESLERAYSYLKSRG